jgi:hypothetical protein
MRPFHRFILRLVIAFTLVFLVATHFQRPATTSEPARQPAMALYVDSENA